MKSQELWKLFEETGAPELYLLYSNARRMENRNAFDDPGTCPAGSELQRY